MSSIPKVLHRTAQPISVTEFVDAVQAICRPRFPGARGSKARQVGLAISGGVDSMALAYLCSRARLHYPAMKIADNPVESYYCIVVDHRVRGGSETEAQAVRDSLLDLGLRAGVFPLAWREVLDGTEYSHPKDLPNFETVARRLRYRKIAARCARTGLASLFFAHHQDDQYETLLMRLLSGHGAAGLLGMRAVSDIPESHDVHGAYRSGMVDDQALLSPMINYSPTRYQSRDIEAQVMAGLDRELVTREMAEFDACVPKTKWMLPVAPPEIEDGGVMVYRPLLEFSKDRLIATCDENGVPWFEDATNQDATLTMRNAIRHLYKSHTLPVALQKPALLDMSRRLRTRAELNEAEVDRLLSRTIVRDFKSTAGTVVVQLPSFRIPRLRRGLNKNGKGMKRLEHYRYIAALLVRRLLAMVTPELQGPFATNLQNAVLRLFPCLDDKPSTYSQHPKAFNVSSVHFRPVCTSSNPKATTKWYLTREPYVSGRPLPKCKFGRLRLRLRWRRKPDQWRMPSWAPWQLWDGRFWVRMANRTRVHAMVAPFDIKHAKAFRDSLPDDGRSRDTLLALLKLHTPGKVRYTLPAIYTLGDYEKALVEYERFSEREKAEMLADEADADREWKQLAHANQMRACFAAKEWERQRGMGVPDENALQNSNVNGNGPEKEGDEDNRVLVALPTLGIARPGLRDWIRYEIRYKGVDRGTLEKSADDEGELRCRSYRYKKSMKEVRMGKSWASRYFGRPTRPRRPVMDRMSKVKNLGSL